MKNEKQLTMTVLFLLLQVNTLDRQQTDVSFKKLSACLHEDIENKSSDTC